MVQHLFLNLIENIFCKLGTILALQFYGSY